MLSSEGLRWVAVCLCAEIQRNSLPWLSAADYDVCLSYVVDVLKHAEDRVGCTGGSRGPLGWTFLLH